MTKKEQAIPQHGPIRPRDLRTLVAAGYQIRASAWNGPCSGRVRIFRVLDGVNLVGCVFSYDDGILDRLSFAPTPDAREVGNDAA